jgi:hypothetical protein
VVLCRQPPVFRGSSGSGFKYSQVNYSVFGKITAPQFFITYAQTQLLLAEAAFRGYISGTASTFYNNGVKAAMDQFSTYDAAAVIPAGTEDAFLNNPLNAYSDANASAAYQYAVLGNLVWQRRRIMGQFPEKRLPGISA